MNISFQEIRYLTFYALHSVKKTPLKNGLGTWANENPLRLYGLTGTNVLINNSMASARKVHWQ